MQRRTTMRRTRHGLIGACALVGMAMQGGGAIAQDLKIVETDQLQVVYFDPSGSYLAPYVTQSFVNSLNAQQKRFGFEPDGKVSVLLQDFGDRGNATAILGAPRNRIYIDVAPPVLSFETFSPGERVYTLSNHELVHTVVGDRGEPGRPDRKALARRQGAHRRPSIPRRSSTTT